MSTYDFDLLAAKVRKMLEAEGTSLRGLVRAHGLKEGDVAHLSRLLRGEAVSAETARRVGRALGIVRGPRNPLRRVLTAEQAAAWDALNQAERNERLGV